MSLLLIKSRDVTPHPRAWEIANCIPNIELLFRASFAWYSTETRFFILLTRNPETNEMDFSEVRATRRAMELNLP